MADLTGQTPAATYKGLLQVNDYTNGVDATGKYIQDGEGTDSALSLSTTNVGIGTASPQVLLHIENSNTSTYSPTSIVSNSAKLTRFRTKNNSATNLQTASINLVSSGNNGTANAEIALNCIQETDISTSSIFTIQQRKSDQSYHETLRIDSAGNVGVGTTSPSAPLEVSSTTGGVIMPRMTTAQRNAIASPTNGEMVYDTDLNKFYGYANGAWTALH